MIVLFHFNLWIWPIGHGSKLGGQSGPEQLQTDLCKLAAQRETLPKDALKRTTRGHGRASRHVQLKTFGF